MSRRKIEWLLQTNITVFIYDKITEIFYIADDFYKLFVSQMKKYIILQ